jgi:hypothetical protein
MTNSADEIASPSPSGRFRSATASISSPATPHIGDDVLYLVTVEAGSRHGRMVGDDSLGQDFGDVLDGIALVQFADRRRDAH